MGRCPPCFNQLASLPEVVVLPEPCSPAMSTIVGGCEANFSLAVSLPRIAISSSRTILITCSAGESAVITSWPSAFSRMWSTSSLTTLKLTSASSSAMRISFSASPMFSSVSEPCPRRFLKARCSLSVRFSNIVRSPKPGVERWNTRVSTGKHQNITRVGTPLSLARCFAWCSPVDLGSRNDGVAVDSHRVLDAVGIPSGKSDHHRNITGAGNAKDEFVPPLQSFDAKVQAAELVLAVRIGASHVADQFGVELPQSGTQRIVQPGQILQITAAVRQVDVNRGRRLGERVVVLLVQRDREDVVAGAFGHGRTLRSVQRGG